ncbi:hypothetical protein D3C73_1495360 [compost metagenome]
MQLADDEIGGDHPAAEQHREDNPVQNHITAHQHTLCQRISHRYREEQVHDGTYHRYINGYANTFGNGAGREDEAVGIQ